MSNRIYSRRRFAGQLVSLASSADPLSGGSSAPFLLNSQTSQGQTPQSIILIRFPAMPDSIELIRSATYTVASLYTSPDGFHQYHSTDPLSIPFSFRLHAQDDEYCTRGGLTLLEIAARLHAMSLPVHDASNYAYDRIAQKAAAPAGAGTSELALEASMTESQQKFVVANKLSVLPPVSVLLDLIRTTEDGPGIRCVGYVKDVSVRLNGPFLRGPSSQDGYNIPTSGDFSFTFVHHPTHSNDGRSQNFNANAMAHVVRDRLYNTQDLTFGGKGTNTGYTTTGL